MGFMAVGKSTVGKVLAERLGYPFVDTDAAIVAEKKMAISDIFAQHGEAYFRSLEGKTISKLLMLDRPHVISTGGGLPCSEANIASIIQYSHSVTLQLGVGRIVERLSHSQDRPLADRLTDSQLRKMVESKLKHRREYYNRADVQVRSIGKPASIADRIIKKLKLQQ